MVNQSLVLRIYPLAADGKIATFAKAETVFGNAAAS
jgi:hypothetical protein